MGVFIRLSWVIGFLAVLLNLLLFVLGMFVVFKAEEPMLGVLMIIASVIPGFLISTLNFVLFGQFAVFVTEF